MRRWEESSKEEDKIAMRKMEGKSLQVEGVQRAPELVASKVLPKEKEPKKDKKKSKVVPGPHRRWKRRQAIRNSKVRRKWCSGGTPVWKKLIR